tara:strand:- start:3138 stop:3353 length:216 start_codon:yes stop_codon:yes gene_type:complete
MIRATMAKANKNCMIGFDMLYFVKTAAEISRFKTKAIAPLKLSPARNSVTQDDMSAIAWWMHTATKSHRLV